jgi:5-methylthioadenosine/S-adenosylhomocysteine deaminase
MNKSDFYRRDVLKLAGASAIAAGAIGSSKASAQTPSAPQEFVVRGAYVLTMDPALGDFPQGDVHVRDGVIVAVGPKVDAPPSVSVIDGTDRIVMPGFVDTHWHLSETFMRGHFRADHAQYGYFPTLKRLAKYFKAEDNYKSVRFATAEAFLAGFTTIHNWSMFTLTPDHADAEIQALTECGARARYSYGRVFDLPLETPMDIADVVQTQKKWAGRSDGMLSMGVSLRTPIIATAAPPPPGVPRPTTFGAIEVTEAEIKAARGAGLPYTIHTGAKGVVGALASRNLLGPDALLCHAQGMTADEIDSVAKTKTLFSTSPVIEMSYSAVRNGTIQFAELEAKGVQQSLSTDSSGASASADFFNSMRALMWSNWHRTDTDLKLQYKPKRLVELATIEGARTLGLGDITGSLKPGKRADLIAVRTDGPNFAPMRDPYNSLVFCGHPSNVELVCVNGRIVVRDGRLVDIDFKKVVNEAAAAADALVERGPKPS